MPRGLFHPLSTLAFRVGNSRFRKDLATPGSLGCPSRFCVPSAGAAYTSKAEHGPPLLLSPRSRNELSQTRLLPQRNRCFARLTAGGEWMRTFGFRAEMGLASRDHPRRGRRSGDGHVANAVGIRPGVCPDYPPALVRGTRSLNPSPSGGEMLWGRRRGWQFRRLHQSMECRDAPAERSEQVPRAPGPR